VLSGRGLFDELITCPEESYRLCCVVVCDLETSRMGAPYIYDVSRLRVKYKNFHIFNAAYSNRTIYTKYGTGRVLKLIKIIYILTVYFSQRV